MEDRCIMNRAVHFPNKFICFMRSAALNSQWICSSFIFCGSWCMVWCNYHSRFSHYIAILVVSSCVLCAQLEIELPPCVTFCDLFGMRQICFNKWRGDFLQLKSISVLYRIIHRVWFQIQLTLFEFVQWFFCNFSAVQCFILWYAGTEYSDKNIAKTKT